MHDALQPPSTREYLSQPPWFLIVVRYRTFRRALLLNDGYNNIIKYNILGANRRTFLTLHIRGRKSPLYLLFWYTYCFLFVKVLFVNRHIVTFNIFCVRKLLK